MSHPLHTHDRTPGSDCRAARQTLELAAVEGTGSADWDRARRHVEHCQECRSFQRRLDQFDEHVAAICRDVPVPEGLATRIQAALDAAAMSSSIQPEPPAASAVNAMARSGVRETARFGLRRRALWSLAAAACVLLALGGIWHFALRSTIDLNQLVSAATGPDAGLLPFFSEGTAPPLPATLNGRIVFSAPQQLAAGRAAVYFFELPASRSGRAVHGRLLVIPAAMVSNRPEANAFLGNSADYRVTGYCSSAWVEGDVAYVCLVEGGEDLLHRLKARPIAT